MWLLEQECHLPSPPSPSKEQDREDPVSVGLGNWSKVRRKGEKWARTVISTSECGHRVSSHAGCRVPGKQRQRLRLRLPTMHDPKDQDWAPAIKRGIESFESI